VQIFRSGDRRALTLFGRGVIGGVIGGGILRLASEWYQSGNIFAFCSREGKFTMSPRREKESPDPEDRDVRRRGRPVGNPEIERQMRDLRARLEDMETTQRLTASAGDLSNLEDEVEA
jgi:hypothetical protein